MNTPHIVYSHGDKIRVYTPSLVVTISENGSYCANLMYLPYTSTKWETMYIVYDGSYYFSKAVFDASNGCMVGDGSISQTNEGILGVGIPGAIDPADAAILSNDNLLEYARSSMVSGPRAMMCVDGTRCIIGPGTYVSDNREVDIISCPTEFQAMYLGFETFDVVYSRLIKRDGLMASGGHREMLVM